jgi:hypothetical protein
MRLLGGLQLKIKYDTTEKTVEIKNDATVSDLKELLKSRKEFPRMNNLSCAGLEMKLTDKLSQYQLVDDDVIDVSKSALQSGNGLILSFEKCFISQDDSPA